MKVLWQWVCDGQNLRLVKDGHLYFIQDEVEDGLFDDGEQPGIIEETLIQSLLARVEALEGERSVVLALCDGSGVPCLPRKAGTEWQDGYTAGVQAFQKEVARALLAKTEVE